MVEDKIVVCFELKEILCLVFFCFWRFRLLSHFSAPDFYVFSTRILYWIVEHEEEGEEGSFKLDLGRLSFFAFVAFFDITISDV